MNLADALSAALAARINFAIKDDRLALKAPAEPPRHVVEGISQHKSTILEMLRSGVSIESFIEKETLRAASLPPTATQIWVEPLRRPEGGKRYTSRGLVYATRLGSPDGPVLCEWSRSPALDSCRALLARGITGRFETWSPGVPYPKLVGDIETAAKLTIRETETDGPRFVKWQPRPDDQDGPPSRRVAPSASEEQV
jgi:hypothetical protein